MSTIVSFILIVASLGGFFAYIDPAFMEIKELQAEKAEYKRALDNSRELQQERDKFLERFNQMSVDDLGKLSTMLPDNIDNVRLIIDLDEMARKHGMRIRDFKADASQESAVIGGDSKPYGTLTLSFSTTASYTTFLAFLRDLEKSLRIIDVTAIRFASSDTSTLYDYSLTIRTYWLK